MEKKHLQRSPNEINLHSIVRRDSLVDSWLLLNWMGIDFVFGKFNRALMSRWKSSFFIKVRKYFIEQKFLLKLNSTVNKVSRSYLHQKRYQKFYWVNEFLELILQLFASKFNFIKVSPKGRHVILPEHYFWGGSKKTKKIVWNFVWDDFFSTFL